MDLLRQIAFYITSILVAIVPSSQYVEGALGQPVSFFPSQAQSTNDKAISKLIYRGLFKYDILGNLIPDLAESWAITDGGLVYTIKLREDMYWSDGRPITADDLIYTAFKVPDLQGVATDKIDSLTVRYTLPNEFSPFLSLLTVGVMQANSEETYNALTPVSSGPFRVLSIKRTGPVVKEVVLSSKDVNTNIRKIVFRYYSNEDELVTAAKLGEIDAFLANEKHDLENFTNRRFPLQGVYYALFMNTKNEKLANVSTRQSLARVLDVERLTSELGIFVEGPISRSQFTDRDLVFNSYDEDFSSDLDLELTLKIPDLHQHRELAARIREVWRQKLGVSLNIVKVDPQNFVKEVIIPRDYELILYGQEIGRDPDRYINWHSTQSQHPGLNLSLFEQVRADRALETGRIQLDPEDRVVHYNEFQKVIVDETPVIFLYHPYVNFYVRNYIDGIGEKYTFTVVDRFLDFSNWKRLKTN